MFDNVFVGIGGIVDDAVNPPGGAILGIVDPRVDDMQVTVMLNVVHADTAPVEACPVKSERIPADAASESPTVRQHHSIIFDL
jgi:hypothetical protein